MDVAEEARGTKRSAGESMDVNVTTEEAFCGAVGLHTQPDYSTLKDLNIDMYNKSEYSNEEVREGTIIGLKLADDYGIYEVKDNADVPKDAQYVDTRWQIQRGKLGVKCRIVGREYTWLETIEDAFAPTSASTTSRCVDFYALKSDTLESDPMVSFEADCTSAFYQTPEDEDFYCLPPREWLMDREARGLTTNVTWKLKKQLPGRRRAAVRWTDHVATQFGIMGLEQYPGMPYFHASLDERKIFIETHMDDFHGTCRQSAAKQLLEELRTKFSLTDSGIIITGTYAHLKRERVRLDSGTWIGTNKQHIRNLQELLGMQDAKPVDTPDLPNSTREGSPELIPSDKSIYKRGVGILLYYVADRIEVQRAVMLCSRHLAAPREIDLKRMKRCVKYLIGHADDGVWLEKPSTDPEVIELDGWVDTDWASDEDLRKSVTAMVVEADAAPLHSRVMQQSIIAQSSGESEFYGIHGCALTLVGFKNLFQWLGFRVKSRVLTDSSAGKAMCQRQGCGKVRHLDLRALWVQGQVKDEGLIIKKCAGEFNKADLGTKSHPAPRFKTLCKLNNIRPRPSPDADKEMATVASVIRSTPYTSPSEHAVRMAIVTLVAAAQAGGALATTAEFANDFACPSVGDGISLTGFAAQFFMAVGLTAVTLGIVIGYRAGAYFHRPPPMPVARSIAIQKQCTTRSIATQSQCTYQRTRAQPRFQWLPELSQGTFFD